MPNFPLLSCGQQAVTTAPTALPSVIPQNPLGSVLSGGAVRGEGAEVRLGNLKASTASFFYGNNNNVATTGANAGKEVPSGSQDVLTVNDLAEIFVVGAANGTATATWSITNK